MENKDIDVKIEDDENKLPLNEDEIEIVSDDQEAVSSPDAEDPLVALSELKKQLEAERRARFEAENKARTAYGEVEETNLALVNNAIETIRRDNEILKANYREAMSVGDYDKAAEIQEFMSGNAVKMRDLEAGKDAMEKKIQSPQKQQQYAPSDPVEAFAAKLSPKSADWIRKNPQCVTDQRLTQKMIAAHQLAIADNIPVDSEEYFGFIEETLRLKPKQEQKQAESPLSSAAKAVPRQAPPPAAPVNNGSARPTVVRLSAAEAEAAKMFGMTEKEYALHKAALKKEGRLTH